jgi:membrane-associated phospholipid phosphatase
MDQINAIEIIVNTFLQNLGAWLRMPMQVITTIGYEQFFILMLPTLYWCFDQMIGLRVGIIFLMGNTVNSFFKLLFHNPRPYWISDSVKQYSHETSFGLPSGHAQTAATVWGWLAVEIKKRWFTVAALILTFLIGLSRIYLGVHFLSDVLLGWLIGGLLVWAFSASYQKIGEWLSDRSLWTKLGLVLLSGAAMIGMVLLARWLSRGWVMDSAWVERAGEVDPLNIEGVFTLGGTWVGMLGGFVILNGTKGNFLAGEGGWRRFVRFLFGLAGVLVLYLGLGQLFPSNDDLVSYLLRFVRYTLIGLWVSWLGPVIFEKCRLLKFEKQTGSQS